MGILSANPQAMNTPFSADWRGPKIAPLVAQTRRLPKVGAGPAYPLVRSAGNLPAATRANKVVTLATSWFPSTTACAWLQKAGAESPLAFAAAKSERVRGAQPKNWGLDGSGPTGGAPGDSLRLSASPAGLNPAFPSPELLGEFQRLVRVLPPSFQPLGQPISHGNLLREDAHPGASRLIFDSGGPTQRRRHEAPRVSLREGALHSTEERESQPPVPYSILPGPVHQSPGSPHFQGEKGPDSRARSPVEGVEARVGDFRDASQLARFLARPPPGPLGVVDQIRVVLPRLLESAAGPWELAIPRGSHGWVLSEHPILRA